MKKIPIKLAVNVCLVVFGLVTIFHLSVITGLISYSIVWGGRLESDAQMYAFETVSLFINLLLLWVVAMRGGYAKVLFSRTTIHVLLWIFAALFALNTLGNLASTSIFEKIVFTPLTLISTFLFIRMALKN